MPKIDAMLRMMSEKAVEKAVLRGGSPYEIVSNGKKVSGPIVTEQQLRQLVEEIVPASSKADFHGSRSFEIRYASPFGDFKLQVENDLGVLWVTITPSKTQPALQPPTKANTPASPTTIPTPAPIPAPSPYPLNPPPTNAVLPSQTGAWPHYPTLPHQGGGFPNHPAPGYNPGFVQKSQKSKVAAGLFGLLLPGLGVHRFYLGYPVVGTAQLLMTFLFSWVTCGLTASLSVLWCFIEGIIILCDGMKDSDGLPLS
ncbi:TM2 domain-containing protein [bacterium]|nr:MAG: TM2 domain-containing protein [bacterium]